jgi:hypothetical protein
MTVSVDNGKYTVVVEQTGGMHALRHGEKWRDLTGDKLVYSLAAEVERLRDLLEWVGPQPGFTGSEWQAVIDGKETRNAP